MFLTRDPGQADDLVQDCVERALLKDELFEKGTDRRAWMFTVMRNVFINSTRKHAVADRHADAIRRETLAVQEPAQFHSAVFARTQSAIERLSEEEREVIRLLAVEQRSHEEVGR